MGFILFLTALILSIALVPIGIVFGFIKALYKRKIGKALKILNEYFYTMAYSVDQFGNVVCAELFNWALIKGNIKFGNPDETISSVLGKNKINKSLTVAGRVLERILNFLDNNHAIKSIENE